MRTIPRNIALPLPRGERRVTCDYCGAKWMRSDCIRDASGFLACPDDQEGRDAVTLDRLNAASASSIDAVPRGTGEDW